MRKRDFIIFFSIVLLIYGLINFYIFIRGWRAIPTDPVQREIYLALFLIFSLSYLAGRFLERITLSWFTSLLVWIGAFWLGAMVYFFLIIYTIDTLRLINSFIPFFPSFITDDPTKTRHVTALAVAGGVAFTVIAGHINTLFPRVRTLHLGIQKKSNPIGTLNIVAASDIHLGTIICKGKFDRIVEKINQLDPDLVLLPGDIVDEDLGPVIQQNLGETLRKIRSKYGIIAITGNHEYIGGVEEAYRYLTDHGVTVLRDGMVRIHDGITVIGREDRSFNRAKGRKRKSLAELMAGVDKRYPVILMDHQPYHLEEAEKNGVDLQLSGHTHHGQLWPFHWITKKIYEVSWGYKKKGDTHIYVSCGVGTWGPPLRIGNRPEIVNIRLTFEV